MKPSLYLPAFDTNVRFSIVVNNCCFAIQGDRLVFDDRRVSGMLDYHKGRAQGGARRARIVRTRAPFAICLYQEACKK